MADVKPFDSDLFMWKNPAKTSVALVCFNILFLAAVYVEGSLIPLLCNASMLAIFVGGAVKFAAPQFAEQNFELMSKDAVSTTVQSVAAFVNKMTAKAQNAVLWTSTNSTIKALVGLEVLRRLSPWISVYFVIFLGGNLVFVVPYLLEAKKDVIEKSIGPHITKARAFKDDLLAKVPKYTDVVKDE